ncbi:hypothetical protein [Veillonella seminalis]|uniref:hypothetical protein n=1 Tax=Veillonella seminalis TaxID=1502943 RepID=UPI00402AF102
MDNYVYLKEQTLKGIANAIRAKTKSSSKITPVNMPVEIAKISEGSPSFKVVIKQTPNQTIKAKVDRIEFVKDYIYKDKSFSVVGLKPIILTTIEAKAGYKAGTIQETQNGNVWTITATEATVWTPEFVEGWAVYTLDSNGDIIRLVNGIQEPWNHERGICDDKSILETGKDTLEVLQALTFTGTIVRLGDVSGSDGSVVLGKEFNAKILDLGENEIKFLDANNKQVIIDMRKLSAGSLTEVLNSVANSSNNSKVTFVIKKPDGPFITPIGNINCKFIVDDINSDITWIKEQLEDKGVKVLTLTDFKKQNPNLAEYL